MHDFIVEEIYVSTDFVYFLNNKASKQETEIRPPKTKRRLTENKLYIFKYPWITISKYMFGESMNILSNRMDSAEVNVKDFSLSLRWLGQRQRLTTHHVAT